MSCTFGSVSDISDGDFLEEYYPEEDFIKSLRPYGVRFISDITSNIGCNCIIPGTVLSTYENQGKEIRPEMAASSQLMWQTQATQDFTWDPYGDLEFQDFLVNREESYVVRNAVLHFAGVFMNIIYADGIRYRIANIPYGRNSFEDTSKYNLGMKKLKRELLRIIKEITLMRQKEGEETGCCPGVNEEAPLKLRSWWRNETCSSSLSCSSDASLSSSSSFEEEDDIEKIIKFMKEINEESVICDLLASSEDPKLLIDVYKNKSRNIPFGYPSYLLYRDNDITLTIEQQFHQKFESQNQREDFHTKLVTRERENVFYRKL